MRSYDQKHKSTSSNELADFVLIPLANGKGFAQISIQDLPKIEKYSWRLNNDGYASTEVGNRANRKVLLMHRVILGSVGKDRTDHINRDRLDNRRSNLRIASPSQNAANSLGWLNIRKSRYKGVSQKRDGWVARVVKDGITYNLGHFSKNEEEKAARAYDSAALYLYKEFATPNFPDSIAIAPQDTSRRKRERGQCFSVGFRKDRNKWVARIRDRPNKYTKHIGYFETKEEARLAGKATAKIYKMITER